MRVNIGFPPSGHILKSLKELLLLEELSYDDALDCTAYIEENGHIIATASREKNILKCIAVSKAHQGEGLAASLLTALIKNAYENNIFHLFIYTKPEHIKTFSELGFYLIANTAQVALLENRRGGISAFINKIKLSHASGTIGCIVANCNPFTKGHLYLASNAAKACDIVYFFVLSEERSLFDFETRFKLVKDGLAHLDNVFPCPTGPYLISSATFPTYFIKDQNNSANAYYDLDLTIFGKDFAKQLMITNRYVGSEPTDMVTNGYNARMKEILPPLGIRVIEIPRLYIDNNPISASTVRSLIQKNDYSKLEKFVPHSTYRFLKGNSL